MTFSGLDPSAMTMNGRFWKTLSTRTGFEGLELVTSSEFRSQIAKPYSRSFSLGERLCSVTGCAITSSLHRQPQSQRRLIGTHSNRRAPTIAALILDRRLANQLSASSALSAVGTVAIVDTAY